MAEILVEFAESVRAPDGTWFRARACGGEARDSMWQGWIEFTPPDGEPVIRSGRETTQPNRQDTVYWATGLSAVYLEGALTRALRPPATVPADRLRPSAYDEPAPAPAADAPPASVLNPYSVYEKGEVLLRRQLAAMSSWHLVNIIRAHDLSDQSPEALGRMSAAELIELIVAAVKVNREARHAE